jgi:hypothetical protein
MYNYPDGYSKADPRNIREDPYKVVDPSERYRGFSIVRERPYHLFEIKPKDGYDLPPMLSGKYTKLHTLLAQVDKFLFENPKATADTAYI